MLQYGTHVISIAEEMVFPTCQSPRLADDLHRLAVANQATVLGTGINPGFMLDLLVIALTGVCLRVDAITAKRINDLSPYGFSVMQSQGIGLTPEAFRQGVENGTVVGYLGFPESISMIARALGWTIDAIETALAFRLLFRLPLQQTEGFLHSVLTLMGLALPCPDHTTLSRRNATVAIRQQVDRAPQESVGVIVDSSGLKVWGQGEWHAQKHGEKKVKRWKKLHLGVDDHWKWLAGEAG